MHYNRDLGQSLGPSHNARLGHSHKLQHDVPGQEDGQVNDLCRNRYDDHKRRIKHDIVCYLLQVITQHEYESVNNVADAPRDVEGD